MSVRNLYQNIALTFFSAGIAVIAVEAMLRIVAPSVKSYANQHQLCCKYDPVMGWVHQVSHTVKFYGNEYEVTESFNSHGVRGPEYSIEKPEGEFRIVVLGDSFAEGYTVDFDQLVSEVLKKRLEHKRPEIEVINFGVGGYSTDQQLLQFVREVKHYQPDLVLLMFHDNDVWYNSQTHYGPWGRGYKPVFGFEKGKLVLGNVPVPLPAPALNSNAEPQRTVSFLNRVKRGVANHSYLYRWIRDKVKNSPGLYSLAITTGLADRPLTKMAGKLPVPAEFEIYRKSYLPEIAYAWEVTEALLGRLREEAYLAQSDLFVFHVPMRAAIYPDEWISMQEEYGIDATSWDIDQVNRELSEILVRQEIEFLNPLERMRAEASEMAVQGKRLYFENDGHWNAEGHKFAGEMLADFINKRFLDTY